MGKQRFAGIVFLVLSLAGCSRQQPQHASSAPQPQMKTAPPTPIAEKKDELGDQSWDPQWDVFIEQALSPEMLSTRGAVAVRPYCPHFAAMSEADKRAFWAYVFQALAGAEAGLKPTTNVRHTEPAVAVKDDVTHRMVRSEGLLQLTYMDAQRYGCDFDWEHDKQLPQKDPAKTILQPKNNLDCGVKIMENQILQKHQGLLARTSYWSTLQPGTVSYRVFAKQMTNVPAACRVAANPNVKRTAHRAVTSEAAAVH
jgi:hypothetical protein